METLLKFRWLIALIIVAGFLVYYNERQVSKGIPQNVVDSLLKWQAQTIADKYKIEMARFADSLLGVKQQGYEDLEKPIMQNYTDYVKNYPKKKPSETDNELIDWSKK